MKIVAFKTGKPKQYKYKPVFYDERKEELEKLKKKYAEEKKDGVSEDFRERLRNSWKIKEKRTGNISRATLLVYFAISAIILYLIFFR